MNTASPRRPQGRTVRVAWWRLALLGATIAVFVITVMEHPTPLTLAFGVVPIAWILIEAVWHLSDGHAGEDEER